MSLAAFTNAPGTHQRYETVAGYQDGKYYSSVVNHELIYSDFIPMETASKWTPTRAFHRFNTDWSRSVRKVTSNRPGKWKRLVKEGNPPDQYVTISLEGDYHISRDHGIGSYIVPDPGYDNGKSESVTKALNNLTQRYAGLGNDVGESKKTIESFSGLALRAGQFLKAFKDRDFRRALEALGGKKGSKSWNRTLADIWLEFQYGWKPLAQDLYDAQAAVHTILEKPLPIIGHGKGSSQNEVTFVWENRYLHEGFSRSSHRTVLEANCVNSLAAGLNQAGLINPISIAWELVPFSFVVDWFVPIGATLQAITAGYGLESNGGWTSSQTEDWLHMEHVPTWTGYGYGIDDVGDYQEIGFSFHRQCYTSFPAPQLYADVTPYSTPRALNAIALLHQL